MPDVVVYKGTGTEVARLVGRTDGFTLACLPLMSVMTTLAARHIRTGNYIRSFGIETVPGKKGVTDRAVTNDDPQAHIIEEGHLQRIRKPNGEPGLKWVDGLHIMERAARVAK